MILLNFPLESARGREATQSCEFVERKYQLKFLLESPGFRYEIVAIFFGFFFPSARIFLIVVFQLFFLF